MKSLEISDTITQYPDRIHRPRNNEHESAGAEMVYDALTEINDIQKRMAGELGLPDTAAEVTAMADEYLVDRAGADTGSDSVRDVIVESALEASGDKVTTGDNPLVILEHRGEMSSAITEVVKELHELHATLPNHPEEVAELAARLLDDIHEHPMMSGEHRVEYLMTDTPTVEAAIEIDSPQPEISNGDTLTQAQSQAWLEAQGIDGFGASHKLDRLLQDIDNLPQLDPGVSRQLLRQTLEEKGRSEFTRLLVHYGEDAIDEELMRMAYAHPEVLGKLVHARPDLAKFMAEHTMKTDTMYRSLLDLYDEAESQELRSSISHHTEVMADAHAESWARHTSMALLHLNAFDVGFGGVTQGAIAHTSPFNPQDNVVTNLNIPAASILPHVSAEQADITGSKITDMSTEEKKLVLNESFLQAHPDLEAITTISLPDLTVGAQELVVANSLIEAQRETHSAVAQARATERNRQIAESGVFLNKDDLVHTTSVEALDDILRDGLVCGELIGEKSINDAYPLNVDFNRVEAGDVSQQTFEQMIHESTAGRHGANPMPRQITLILPKSHSFTERAADVADPHHKHRLAFGAVAATEIGGIVLNDDQSEESKLVQMKVLRSVLEQNTYIPVISKEGKVLLDYEEFVAKKSTYLDHLSAGNYAEDKPDVQVVDEDTATDHSFDLPDIGAF